MSHKLPLYVVPCGDSAGGTGLFAHALTGEAITFRPTAFENHMDKQNANDYI